MANRVYRLNDIYSIVKNDDRNKIDIFAQPKKMIFKCNGENKYELISKSKGERILLNENSLTSLFNRYNIPVREAKILLNRDSRYIEDLVNQFLNLDDSEMLIRARILNKNTAASRAILSENYSILNNNNILKILYDLNIESKGMKISNFNMNDGFFHLRFVFDPKDLNVGKSLDNANDILKYGIDIINSETGRASFGLEPMVWRLVCSNGLKAWRKDEGGIRQRHIYINENHLLDLVRTGISNSLNKSEELAESFIRSKNIPVENPVVTIERIAHQQKVPKKVKVLAERAFYKEPEFNWYGVVNAFTRAARSLQGENRLNIERLAGRMLSDKELLELAS